LLALRAAGDLTPVAAALAYFVPGALYTVWLTFRLVPRMRFRIRALAGDARAILSYGLRAYGTDVIAALSLQIDQAVIVAFLSPMQLGLYAVALSLSRIITVAQQAIVMVLFPYASGLPAEEAIALVGRAVRATNAASVAMGALFLLVMPFALPFFYGHAFAQALEILPVLAAEAILAGAAIVLGQAFLATGRPGVVTSVQAVWLATVLALLVAFVPHLDVRGAALALLVGSVARLAFLALMYRRILGRALPRLVPEISDWSMLARKGRATLALGASLLLKESTT
jgi:O-antigen/teichoic acid export membrane protein